MTIFLQGQKSSQTVQLVLADLNSLKRPLAIKFTKKNDIHPFEDASSLEFFSLKNDASLLVMGHHSKKRPNALTIARCFDSKLLDMLELYVVPETFRQLQQFKNKKCAVGLKPLITFSGTPFESPTPNSYTLAKSLFLDLFKGQDTKQVDVEGLQYMIHISAGEEVEGQPAPAIHLRAYLIKTKKSGQKLPRVEVEEMGPRIDFRVGRMKEADEGMWKDAVKKPRGIEVRVLSHEEYTAKLRHVEMLTIFAHQARPKKNIETDLIGDKVGRIHVGKQDLAQMQTRKMKGLKRSREDDIEVGDVAMEDQDVKKTKA